LEVSVESNLITWLDWRHDWSCQSYYIHFIYVQ